MAIQVIISDPFSRITKRLDHVQLDDTIINLKMLVFEKFGFDVSKQELLYFGRVLQDEKPVSFYDIKDNTTVYLMKKTDNAATETEQKSSQTVDEIATLLSKAKNPAFEPMLKKFFQNKESVEKIINENEVLKNDLIVSALLRDPDLSLPMLEALSPERIIETYPNMGIALKVVLSNLSVTDSIGRQALLQNPDDDTDYEGVDPTLLAQAELMATNETSIVSNQQDHQTTNAVSRQSTSQQEPARISASELANALSFATMTSNRAGSTAVGGSTPQPDYSEALAQMNAFGATDELVNRRALAMSGGNVEMALNLVFEGALD